MFVLLKHELFAFSEFLAANWGNPNQEENEEAVLGSNSCW